jgi:hypothetical protein
MSDKTIEFLETAHRLSESVDKVCDILDVYEMFPDDMQLPAADIKAAFASMKKIIRSQQTLINSNTERFLQIDDSLDEIEEHLKP